LLKRNILDLRTEICLPFLLSRLYFY
jgi:hypothetical protein